MEFVKKVGFGDVFEYAKEMELLKIFRFDTHNMITMERFKFKDPSFHPQMLVGMSGIKFVQILKEDPKNGEYTLLVKTHATVGFDQIFNDFDFILDYPIHVNQEGLTIPFISSQKNLKAILESVKKIAGNQFKVLSISSVKPNIESIKALLTEKQQDIISFAAKKGYFEIPRKISSQEISKHFDISISAVNEHLRKIERRIFNHLFVEQ